VLATRIFGRITTCVLSFYLTTVFIDEFQSTPHPKIEHTGRCATGPAIALDRPFDHESGFAVSVKVPGRKDVSDESPNRSPLIICENGKELGPAHSLHNDIRLMGLGRYSHWEEQAIFSASDNLDPQRNGREYSAIIPASPRPNNRVGQTTTN
jgi:hypothetical protein